MPRDTCDGGPLRLHPELERWARDQGWERFRPFQEESADLILGSDCDLIISASTSAGKSEAAFLPLLTLAAARPYGVSVLCLSPTKALINDQVRRLVVPASRVRVPIFAWHGDAPQSGKRKLIRDRLGVVIMTVESLEGRMIRHPRMVEEMFSNLDAVVIDEFHEFLQGARGAQLNALLARLDQLTHRANRRIALSATIADPASARRWIRMQEPKSVRFVNGPEELKGVRSRIRGYVAPAVSRPSAVSGHLRHNSPHALGEIEASIFDRLRTGTHIVFALSRANVEALADGLSRRCERRQVHNPFVPHHGSISKQSREDVEGRLRSGEELTVLSTTTLGLGIDVGSVNSVELIGAPISLTALRQYIGRSGRRDAPAAVSLHVTELPRSSAIKLGDRLRLSTVRACAALNLLEQRFFEPPSDDGTTLSVVFQEALSIIKQRGSVSFSQLLNVLQSVAAFDIVTEKILRHLVAHVASPDQGFIEETSDGRYILTQKGEKLVHAPEFYAAFRTTEQWDIVAEDKRKVGSISLSNALTVGDTFCLDGDRWEVTWLDLRHYRATVKPSLGGGIPIFDPMLTPEIHERLAQEMRRVLEAGDVPADLDPIAVRHLEEGRSTYKQLDLATHALVQDGDLCHVISWRGSRFNKLLVELLRSLGFLCSADEVGVTVVCDDARRIIAALAGELPTVSALSPQVGGILNGKYDRHVPKPLLRQFWATRHASLEPSLQDFCRSLSPGARSTFNVSETDMYSVKVI